jgi:pimeloyl-ACP methyl ester carboxylesterase
MKITLNRPCGHNRATFTLLLVTITTLSCVKTVREKDLFFPQRTPELAESESLQLFELKTDSTPPLRGVYLHKPGQRADLLYFYGNAETLYDSYSRLTWLMETFKVNIIGLDYRGYGVSEGVPDVTSLQHDAVLLVDRYKSLTDTTTRPLIVYGRSIGTVPALAVAGQRAIAGLILEAPFPTASAVIASWEKNLPIPVRWVVKLRPEKSLAHRRPQPIDFARQVTCPLLVIHGSADETIPFSLGQDVYQSIPGQVKSLCRVDGKGHNDLDLAAPVVKTEIHRFLERVMTSR